jgi:hypothetical protein
VRAVGDAVKVYVGFNAVKVRLYRAKKGRGQRKSRRDAAGRSAHAAHTQRPRTPERLKLKCAR